MAITRYILQIHCPDQKGLIAGTTQVLAKAGANIVDLQQHTAKDIETFFLRAVFEADSDNIEEIRKHLQTLEGHLQLNWNLFDTTKVERVAIFVSKTDHCLYDLLLKKR
ncbi:MAG: ACT domain-containing protein, partial [Fibrobacter sp.]|nr:ACT domain-containing protein [Fibrobacter sp.]